MPLLRAVLPALLSTSLLIACGGGNEVANEPPSATYRVSGTIEGRTTSGMVLFLNDAEPLAVPAGATSFAFPTALPTGAPYRVLIGTYPSGQACTLANGQGTIATADVADVRIACPDVPTGTPELVTLRLAIDGLPPGAGGLRIDQGILQNLVPAGATSYQWPTQVRSVEAFHVRIARQPDAAVQCTVGEGRFVEPAVAVVAIHCTPVDLTLGGTVFGLGSATGLVLANGDDRVAIPVGGGAFTFPAVYPAGSSYRVTVATQPTGATCNVTTARRGVVDAPVRDVTVFCTPQGFAVGGAVSGLTGIGLQVAVAGAVLDVPAGATRYVAPRVATGAYGIEIDRQPAGQLCSAVPGGGTLVGADVTNADLVCVNEGVVSTVATLPTSGIEGQPELGQVGALAVGPAGVVYFTMPSRNEVWRLDPGGAPVRVGGNGMGGLQDGVGADSAFRFPTGLAVDAAGNVLVADSGNERLRRMDASGRWTTLPWVPPASQRRMMGLAIDARTGSIYVAATIGRSFSPADAVIERVAPDGTSLGRVFIDGDGVGVTHLAWQDGVLYGLAQRGLLRLDLAQWPDSGDARFDVATLTPESPRSGALALVHRHTSAESPFSGGLAVDATGNVYATTFVGTQVWRYDAPVLPGRVPYAVAGTNMPGSLDGPAGRAALMQPGAMAVEASGALLIAQRGSRALRRLVLGAR